MCKWGTDKLIHVIRRNNPDVPDGWHPVYVDACIADYVQEMNDRGIITVGCCCGHGKGPAWVQVAQESIPLLNKHKYAWRWYADRTDSVMHDMPRQPGMLPYPDIQVAIVPGLDVRDIEIFQAAEKALDAVFAPLGFERSESTKDGRYVRIVYERKSKANSGTSGRGS